MFFSPLESSTLLLPSWHVRCHPDEGLTRKRASAPFQKTRLPSVPLGASLRIWVRGLSETGWPWAPLLQKHPGGHLLQ